MMENDSSAVKPATPEENQAKADDASAKKSAKSLLSEHKGKLAIGAAATLGLMIFYNWRQKKLAEEDPEAYARLQRVKDSLKAEEQNSKRGNVPPAPAS
ncbi:hypothetical protein [Noviherbaspirillum massiliense]|nr:hypothetical protein [Noviherbaspirillum massiliense]